MEKDMTNMSGYSAQVLAYLGDAFYELLVRERIVNGGDCNVSELFGKAKSYVSAVSQSAAAERVLPLLTEEEEAVYRRGRNAKTPHTPRSAVSAEYHRASGLETLFGWLYIRNQTERARRIFDLCFPAETEEKK